MMRALSFAGWVAMPAAFLVHFLIGKSAGRAAPWEPGATFFLAGLGVVPLARVMGQATEQLSEQAGPTWGGLINATFGNAAELIIGIIALTRGMNDIVRASLTGSILGNLLLVGGGAMLAGGWNRERQVFNRSSAQTNAGLLSLAVASMLFPAIFDFTCRFYEHVDGATLGRHEQAVSIGTCVILLVVYALGLLFTLRTHAHIYSPAPGQTPEDPLGIAGLGGVWTVKKSIGMLCVASVGIALLSELLVGSTDAMARKLGWNHTFVGIILLAVIGNAAEHSTAVLLARKNDMDTAMTITYQSSLQIALFVTPVLVLLSTVLVGSGLVHPPGSGHAKALNLVFSPMEVVAVVLTVGIVVLLGMDGQTNWFEGVMLLALYVILGLAFFYMPGRDESGYDEAVPSLIGSPPPAGRVSAGRCDPQAWRAGFRG
jgi:Ca2+:H+ antiporter